MNESDPRSDMHYLGSSENKAWKKFWIFYHCEDHFHSRSVNVKIFSFVLIIWEILEPAIQ